MGPGWHLNAADRGSLDAGRAVVKALPAGRLRAQIKGWRGGGLVADSARGARPIGFEQSVGAVLGVPEINRVFLSEAPCNPDRLVS
jgi:hypothetical protein